MKVTEQEDCWLGGASGDLQSSRLLGGGLPPALDQVSLGFFPQLTLESRPQLIWAESPAF